MTTYGSVDDIRILMGLAEGEEEEKIATFHLKANRWLTRYLSFEVLSELSTASKDEAVNFYAVYLLKLSAERFTGIGRDYYTDRWKEEALLALEQELNSDAEPFKLHKVNDEEGMTV